MKLPTWATVVGVLMILFGGCGTYNNITKINTPKMLEMTSTIFEEISSEIDISVEDGEFHLDSIKDVTMDSITHIIEELSGQDMTDSTESAAVEKIFGSMSNMLNFSDYYLKWIVRLGIIGTIVALIYLMAGIFLVMGKPFALKLSYIALGLSIAFMIFQIVIMSMDKEGGMISRMSTNVSAYFMIFANIILLIIIKASDGSYFYQDEIIVE